jgi:hypothetical protein
MSPPSLVLSDPYTCLIPLNKGVCTPPE